MNSDLSQFPHIEQFEFIETLGSGGMATVYKARQTILDRIVAVKVLSKQAIKGDEEYTRFQNEAKLTSNLNHKNIVKIISFGMANEQAFLVMEYLEGETLAQLIKREKRLTLAKFKDIFLLVLSALDTAHQLGIIHRDIKPSNIFLARDSDDTIPKVVDFGIAKLTRDNSQRLTATGVLIGTPAYMSPEQCAGKNLDGRSDLYSLACVMYEVLTGAPPFAGESSLEVMQKHLKEQVPEGSLSGLKPEMAKLILSALSKDAQARPQTASEFALRVSNALEDVTLDKVPQIENITGKSKIAVAIMLAAVTLICITAGGLLVAHFKSSSKRNPDSVIQKPLASSLNRPNTINSLTTLRLAIVDAGESSSTDATLRSKLKEVEDILSRLQKKDQQAQKYFACVAKAKILERLHDYPGAVKEFKNAANYSKENAKPNAATIYCYETIAELEISQGKLDEAKKYAEMALLSSSEEMPLFFSSFSDELIGWCWCSAYLTRYKANFILGECVLRRQANPTDSQKQVALSYMIKGRDQLRSGSGVADSAEAAERLATFLWKIGRRKDAMKEISVVESAVRQELKEDIYYRDIVSFSKIANFYQEIGNKTQAIKYNKEGLAWAKKAKLRKNSPVIAQMAENLKKLEN